MRSRYTALVKLPYTVSLAEYQSRLEQLGCLNVRLTLRTTTVATQFDREADEFPDAIAEAVQAVYLAGATLLQLSAISWPGENSSMVERPASSQPPPTCPDGGKSASLREPAVLECAAA